MTVRKRNTIKTALNSPSALVNWFIVRSIRLQNSCFSNEEAEGGGNFLVFTYLFTEVRTQKSQTILTTGAKSEISTSTATVLSLALKFNLERNKIQTLDSMNNVFKGVCGNFSQEGKKSNKKNPTVITIRTVSWVEKLLRVLSTLLLATWFFFLNYPN